MDLRDAYIQVLESEIVALNEGVQRSNTWWDKMDWSRRLLNEERSDDEPSFTDLCDELYETDICRYLSNAQYTYLLGSFIHIPNRCKYRIAMSRVNAGIPLLPNQVNEIHRYMPRQMLIRHMVEKPPPDSEDYHMLCKQIGYPPYIDQLNCSHKKNSEIICLKCYTMLRRAVTVPYNAMEQFYVPDKTIELLRRKRKVPKIPKKLLDQWSRKNAKFRKYGIRPKIIGDYKF